MLGQHMHSNGRMPLHHHRTQLMAVALQRHHRPKVSNKSKSPFFFFLESEQNKSRKKLFVFFFIFSFCLSFSLFVGIDYLFFSSSLSCSTIHVYVFFLEDNEKCSFFSIYLFGQYRRSMEKKSLIRHQPMFFVFAFFLVLQTFFVHLSLSRFVFDGISSQN